LYSLDCFSLNFETITQEGFFFYVYQVDVNNISLKSSRKIQ
jgi:hypothetical protein